MANISKFPAIFHPGACATPIVPDLMQQNSPGNGSVPHNRILFISSTAAQPVGCQQSGRTHAGKFHGSSQRHCRLRPECHTQFHLAPVPFGAQAQILLASAHGRRTELFGAPFCRGGTFENTPAFQPRDCCQGKPSRFRPPSILSRRRALPSACFHPRFHPGIPSQGFSATTRPFFQKYRGVPCMRAVLRATRAERRKPRPTAAAKSADCFLLVFMDLVR